MDSPSPKDIWSDLSLYFMLALEIAISYSAPGIVSLQIFHILSPNILPKVLPAGQLEPFHFTLALITATTLGLIWGVIGDWLLATLDRFKPFAAQIDNTIIEAYVSTQAGAADIVAWVRGMTREQSESFFKLSKEEQAAAWTKCLDDFQARAKNDFHKKTNLGLAMMPIITSHQSSVHRKGLRAYLSGPDSVYAFCRGMLPVLMFAAGSTILASTSHHELLLTSAAAFALITIWVYVCIRTYTFLRISQLTVWFGLGLQSEFPTHK